MLIEKLNYNEYLKSLDIEFGQRLENINELINSIIKYEEANPNGTISNYLQEISLYTSATEQKLNRDTVSLMTIHTAKGSEYRAIFVIGMNEGVFPSMSFGKQNDIEEERRIAYVAMTRAREILYLTSASGFSSIKQQPLTDSRFLKEIGNNNITYDINRAVTLSDLSQD
jgi:DNA helicase-2/ATP-dependent DNA helicase PcrA